MLEWPDDSKHLWKSHRPEVVDTPSALSQPEESPTDDSTERTYSMTTTYHITRETVDSYAFTNASQLSGEIRGIVLCFHGLGGCASLITEPDVFARAYAQAGLLYIMPYDSPWSWMNDTAVRTTDQILSAVQEKYGLDPSLRVVSTGGSMGGLSCLIYARYAGHPISAVAANCPVCDLPTHFTERPDLPRTIYSAFAHYSCGVEEAVRLHSPLHQADRLPDIPYYIVHGDGDTAVNKALHSDRLVAKMRQLGYSVEYREVPGMLHCQLPQEEIDSYIRFVVRQVLGQ